MKHISILLILCGFSLQAQKSKLNHLWDSPAELPTNESVLYDPSEDRLFVSCIDGKPTDKDGQGHISILNLEGDIVEAQWASGLSAPKGMTILAGHLYVSDIDRIAKINLENPEEKEFFEVKGAKFLNDLTHDGESVYCSDMAAGKLHRLKNVAVSTLAENIKGLNGLAFHEEGLYGLASEGLILFDLSSGEKTLIHAGMTGGDGLVVLSANEFLASRWQGEIWHLKNGDMDLLFSSAKQEIQTADIGYNPEQIVIYAPRFFSNYVSAFSLP